MQKELIAKKQKAIKELPFLMAYLRKHKIAKASQIRGSLGYCPRTCRFIAEASEGKIIGSEKGYHLTASATPIAFANWERGFRSRIKKMQKRLIQTQKAWHGRIN
jgi:hypothetical protein